MPYTVTARDDSTLDYVVTVTAEAPGSDATLRALDLSAGTLSPGFSAGTTSYTVSVANDVENVTVTATANDEDATLEYSPSQTASPDAGESATVTVTVTAQDGSTVLNYVVTVTRAASSSKAITAFYFASLDVAAAINQTAHTIAATVPYGTAVTSLVPTITHTGASVSPASGAAQDFTGQVTYTVTAQDDSTQDYKVTVTVASGTELGTIAGHEQALESVLDSIPDAYINSARENFHVAYNHSSHGTHVSYGVYGLEAYTAEDAELFGVSTSGESGKLDFSDSYQGGGITGTNYCGDLSVADTDWSKWVEQNETYLDDPDYKHVNVILWSWCDITGHDVGAYLESMQTLIDEYVPGGSKIVGDRTEPVTFIFMTGHANQNANTGEGNPKAQAELILDYCQAHGYYCLDYYSIDTHDMDGNYWEDSSDDAVSSAYQAESGSETGNFYADWQDAHTEGAGYYYNLEYPGSTDPVPGVHNSQHITANRKAYAFWWILARMAGWGE